MEKNSLTVSTQQGSEVQQQLAILSQQMMLLSGQLSNSQPPKLAGDNIFFTDYMVGWFQKKKNSVNPKTWEDYEGLYRNHVLPVFRNTLLSDITATDLEKFYFSLLDKLAPGTVNKIKASIIGNALKKAYAQRLIQFDPTIGIDAVKGEDKHHEPYTQEELRRLAKVSRSSYTWIAFPLLVSTGMRRAELLALTWNDFNVEHRTLHIVHDYVSTSKGSMVTGTKTNASKRLVVLPQSMCDLLEAYQVREGQGKTYIISQQKQDKPVEPHNFSRTYRKWCEQAEIPKEKWGGHCTRATFCTMASEAGCSLDGIRRQVGHSDNRMLIKVYIHERTNQKQYTVADTMGQILDFSLFLKCPPSSVS